ncbi:MAG: hypothetical protein ACLQHL_11720 [Candidatus Cybelea sp.]|jgi:hypothetical protein
MRFTQRITIAAAAAMAVVASAAPAMANGYNGSWPVTITHSQRSNGTGCLTLTGYARAGTASLVFGSQKYSYGSFVVVDDIIVANITEPLYGQNGALMFMAHASHGHIGQGVFENIEGGSNFDYGALTFGTKNGC